MTAPKRKCFVLSPIGADNSAERSAADVVLKHVIRKGLGEGWEVVRADEDPNPGAITPRIIASIFEADLIVADLSGSNPNVFYELAVAHGYHKPVVHIQRANENRPFDVKDMRVVPYDTTQPDELEAAQRKVREFAEFAVANPETIETPLSDAARFIQVQTSEDPVAESNVQVMEAINALRHDIKRSTSRARPRNSERLLERARADGASLMSIVDRVVADGRALETDFSHVITDVTTTSFDSWARERLARVVGKDDLEDPDELDEVLVDPSVLFGDLALSQEPLDED